MRSGLYNYTDYTGLGFTRTWQPQELIDIANRRPLWFEPGTRSLYSNTNYIVLGLIAEKVTGRTVEHLLQTRIFDPAGMTATSLEWDRVSEPPIAHGYDQGNDVTAADLSLIWTAGGVVSGGGCLATRPYFSLVSLNSTCLRARGSYFFSSIFSGRFRGFFFAT